MLHFLRSKRQEAELTGDSVSGILDVPDRGGSHCSENASCKLVSSSLLTFLASSRAATVCHQPLAAAESRIEPMLRRRCSESSRDLKSCVSPPGKPVRRQTRFAVEKQATGGILGLLSRSRAATFSLDDTCTVSATVDTRQCVAVARAPEAAHESSIWQTNFRKTPVLTLERCVLLSRTALLPRPGTSCQNSSLKRRRRPGCAPVVGFSRGPAARAALNWLMLRLADPDETRGGASDVSIEDSKPLQCVLNATIFAEGAAGSGLISMLHVRREQFLGPEDHGSAPSMHGTAGDEEQPDLLDSPQTPIRLGKRRTPPTETPEDRKSVV